MKASASLVRISPKRGPILPLTTMRAALADGFAVFAAAFLTDFPADLAFDFFAVFGNPRFAAFGLRAPAFRAAALLPRVFLTRARRANALVLPARLFTRRACRFVEAMVDLPESIGQLPGYRRIPQRARKPFVSARAF